MTRKTEENAKFDGYALHAASDFRKDMFNILTAMLQDGERIVLSLNGQPVAFIAPIGDLYELDDVDAADLRVAEKALEEHRRDLAPIKASKKARGKIEKAVRR